MRPVYRSVGSLAAALLLFACGCANRSRPTPSLVGPTTPEPHPSVVAPRPLPIDPPEPAAIRAAMDRGVAFLVESQNDDGSWGDNRPKGYNIGMPVPMGFHALRVAVTSLAVIALIESDAGSPGAETALRRSEDWLIANVPKLRVTALWAMFNNWGHAYAIRALVRMLEHSPMDAERRAAVRKIVAEQIARLARRQHLDGGWGYYAWRKTQRPMAGSMSFCSASVMIALYEARQAGFHVPKRVTDRAVAHLQRMRRPDGAFGYSWGHRWYPTYGINTAPGSLSRSQVCNAALHLFGDERTTPAVIEAWLNRLFAREGWFDSARKHHAPHAGYFQLAGYFYFYGMFYAAYSLQFLAPEKRQFFRDYLAHFLLLRQEKDGSWWDFPLYGYHREYGTAYAVYALSKCEDPVQKNESGEAATPGP
jgi:hypothetical protein